MQFICELILSEQNVINGNTFKFKKNSKASDKTVSEWQIKQKISFEIYMYVLACLGYTSHEILYLIGLNQDALEDKYSWLNNDETKTAIHNHC